MVPSAVLVRKPSDELKAPSGKVGLGRSERASSDLGTRRKVRVRSLLSDVEFHERSRPITRSARICCATLLFISRQSLAGLRRFGNACSRVGSRRQSVYVGAPRKVLIITDTNTQRTNRTRGQVIEMIQQLPGTAQACSYQLEVIVANRRVSIIVDFDAKAGIINELQPIDH